MKNIVLLLLWIPSLYAPYDANQIGKQRKHKNFFIRYDPKMDCFVRIRIHSCIIDEEHLNQPERLNERDLPQGMRKSELYTKGREENPKRFSRPRGH